MPSEYFVAEFECFIGECSSCGLIAAVPVLLCLSSGKTIDLMGSSQ